jgi:hypothetical protein
MADSPSALVATDQLKRGDMLPDVGHRLAIEAAARVQLLARVARAVRRLGAAA